MAILAAIEGLWPKPVAPSLPTHRAAIDRGGSAAGGGPDRCPSAATVHGADRRLASGRHWRRSRAPPICHTRVMGMQMPPRATRCANAARRCRRRPPGARRHRADATAATARRRTRRRSRPATSGYTSADDRPTRRILDPVRQLAARQHPVRPGGSRVRRSGDHHRRQRASTAARGSTGRLRRLAGTRLSTRQPRGGPDRRRPSPSASSACCSCSFIYVRALGQGPDLGNEDHEHQARALRQRDAGRVRQGARAHAVRQLRVGPGVLPRVPLGGVGRPASRRGRTRSAARTSCVA